MNDNTISELLRQAAVQLRHAGAESPRLDAEVLLANRLGCERLFLYTHIGDGLDEAVKEQFLADLRKRERREPLAYITGHKEFMGYDFLTPPGVLIPRPDTESVVETALELLGRYPADQVPAVLDLCTGSGAIGISLALEHPKSRVTLSDISNKAITVSTKNAERLKAQVQVVQTDLLEGHGVYTLIVSNPPYIPAADIDTLQPEIAGWEPRLALDGGEDGYAVYDRIIREAGEHLIPGGALVLEAGDGQSGALLAMLARCGFVDSGSRTDLTGTARAVFGFKSIV